MTTESIFCRVLSGEFGSDGILKLKLVDDDRNIYFPRSSGAVRQGQDPGGIAAVAGAARAALMDIATLRDVDDGAGFYAAMAGPTDEWPGGILYESRDGGITWTPLATFLNVAPMGFVTSALPYAPSTLWDHDNSLTVRLFSADMALESITKATALQGNNVALIGNEVVIFRDATQVDSTTWTIATFIRGLFGTEWAAKEHVTNDRFVFLSSSQARRITQELTDLDAERKYRAVTVGDLLENAGSQIFTDTGVSLKPISPVHISLAADTPTAGDITISWVRRSRVWGQNGRDFYDPPLAEDSESYEIDIYDDAENFKRTLTSTEESVVYTSTQRSNDFGYLSSDLNICPKIYQLSAQVGRGYAGEYCAAVAVTPFAYLRSISTLDGILGLGPMIAATATETAFAVWPSASKAFYVGIKVADPIQIRSLWWVNGTSVAGNVDIGIYDSAGTLIVSTGAVAQSGTQQVQVESIDPLTLTAGFYYAGVSVSSTSGFFLRSAANAAFGNGWSTFEEASAHPLPDVATFSQLTHNYYPCIGVLTE